MPHKQTRRVTGEDSRLRHSSISGVKSKKSIAEMVALHSQGPGQSPKFTASNLKSMTLMRVVEQSRRARGRYMTIIPERGRECDKMSVMREVRRWLPHEQPQQMLL